MTTDTATPRKHLTPADITPGLKTAVRAYLLAKVYADVEAEKMAAVNRELLAAREYFVNSHWKEDGMGEDLPERIVDRKISFLMSDADSAIFFAAHDERIKALGYDLPFGHCPALIAESVVRKAVDIMGECMAEMMGVKPDLFVGLCGEHRERFIDLAVKLVVNLPDFRNPLTGEAVK